MIANQIYDCYYIALYYADSGKLSDLGEQDERYT